MTVHALDLSKPSHLPMVSNQGFENPSFPRPWDSRSWRLIIRRLRFFNVPVWKMMRFGEFGYCSCLLYLFHGLYLFAWFALARNSSFWDMVHILYKWSIDLHWPARAMFGSFGSWLWDLEQVLQSSFCFQEILSRQIGHSGWSMVPASNENGL